MLSQDWIFPFCDAGATPASVGGKGANLVKLTRAGLPVPGGFLVGTDAYHAFVAENRLDTRITGVLERLPESEDANAFEALEAASAEIRAAFASAMLPAALADTILAAYDALGTGGNSPVAVRSSATVEDLPDLSFAGQQDTFLNVLRAGLLEAVVNCWSSLWTARAIGYRARNQISSDSIALAVVVQEMVQSEVSGVLFTANPLTGHRGQSVIDATFGLGEALVGGHVEPDQYVVENASGAIRQRTLGAKAVIIRGLSAGGTETVATSHAAQASLTDVQISELVQLGMRVQALYGGAPQDIEWGWAEGVFYLLQARPITSLYPVPQHVTVEPPSVMVSFASVQGVMDPFTPLGIDVFGLISSAAGSVFDYDFAPGSAHALKWAGQRGWIDITPVLGNILGTRAFTALFSMVAPNAASNLKALGLFDTAGKPPLPTPETVRRLRSFFFPIARRAALNLRNPDAAREAYLQVMEGELAALEIRSASPMRLSERVAFVRELFAHLVPTLLRNVGPLILPGIASQFGFIKLAERAGIETGTAFTITRGMPHNVTIEMDLALWRTAQRIAVDAESSGRFVSSDAAELAEAYLAGALPPVAQAALQDFLHRYGMRGVAEIDMGRRRWREEPTQVMQMVQNYLRIDDPDRAPDAVYAHGKPEGEAIVDKVANALRAHGEDGAARLASFLGKRARALAGLREYPKFVIVRTMGIARTVLDAAFAELAQQGVIMEAGDGVFLRLDELRAIDAGYLIDWKALVAERKELYAREQRRAQVPDLLLGDGRAFYGGNESDAPHDGKSSSELRGTPVSAGTVEGRCHVVLEPHKAELAHGEILICPATDPAWTPLFLSAGGLVMEVGGMMTHGSVVAREYGIPAVVGVRDATKRLTTGMRVRLNGSTGVITVLEAVDEVM